MEFNCIIILNTIKKVNNFIECVKEYEGDVYIKGGRYIVDGKSVLGIFSLDLMQPLKVVYESNEQDDVENFYNDIKKFMM